MYNFLVFFLIKTALFNSQDGQTISKLKKQLCYYLVGEEIEYVCI